MTGPASAVHECPTGFVPRAPLWNRGFISLLCTQFFEASSDNIIKTLLTFAVALGKPWDGAFGQGGGGVVGIAFTVPFILLSAYGGRIADRYSKRNVTVVLKLLAFAVAALALFGFGGGHPWTAFSALVLFSTISAFFGPAKYGMIAELVAPHEIARANGVINMATNVAVILGIGLAGVVASRWGSSFVAGVPTGIGAWIPGIVMSVFVLGGFLTCLTLPRLRAANPSLPVELNPLATYVQTLREMSRGPLLPVALAWTFFYFVAAVALLILPDYSTILKVDEAWIGALMGVLGITIGIGCVAAAWLDRPERRSWFVPAGAAALGAGFLAMGLVTPTYALMAALLALTGLFAGFYIIPLQSLLQILSPDDARGRYLGTANGISFVAAAIGSGMYLGLRHYNVMESNRIFAVLGALCLLMAFVVMQWLRRVPKG